ncbi:MAG TPA: methyltransferase domain-containing protein [Candidatus Acidoferrales bacterium]|nr:methyltransferase domain-containing protein [Candidatus Acidoferrales bacterium]
MAEFTGERLIPGEVDIDLLNEHMARYAFAARLARGKRVLDAGCGAGYGSAALAQVAESVTGVDVAADAIDHARAQYQARNLTFEPASVTQLPFAEAAFDLVVAFEVIEHLEDWRGMLQEAARVLSPAGQLIVSTPNKLYYTESRGVHGANPFHVHEFEFVEFVAELKAVFPHVSMFLENHVEGVAFQPHVPGYTVEARVDTGEPLPDESHFFVAVCARRPQLGNPTFVYVPRAANVLREREHHIAKLEQEVATKNQWLDKAQRDLAEFDREQKKLMAICNEQKDELERSNHWAEDLNAELAERRARIKELQDELIREQENARRVAEGFNAKIAALEQENSEKTQWAIATETRLTAEVRQQTEELVRAVAALEQTGKELEARTEWAQRLDEEKRRLEDQLTLVRASRWVRLGRKVGVGPAL